MSDIKIILEDGTEFEGKSFGYQGSAAGEVVFSTAMSGYPEGLTDPTYKGQILVMSYPLIGNYGVPQDECDSNNIPKFFESDHIFPSALVVTDYTPNYSHWNISKSLGEWMNEHRVPGIYGVDTRALTKRLRDKGSMLGKVVYKELDVDFYNPYNDNLVEMVSCKEKIVYGNGAFRLLLIDCGVKYNLIRDLINNGATVIRVPWDYDFLSEEYDGLLISNGPGDPKKCGITIQNVAKAMQRNHPIIGISLGGHILALAAGADIFKLKHGHRSHNQPVKQKGSNTAIITSQNHIFAVDVNTLSDEWILHYENLNDGTNEGFRHKTKPFFATQFHHEPSGETPDKEYILNEFIEAVKSRTN